MLCATAMAVCPCRQSAHSHSHTAYRKVVSDEQVIVHHQNGVARQQVVDFHLVGGNVRPAAVTGDGKTIKSQSLIGGLATAPALVCPVPLGSPHSDVRHCAPHSSGRRLNGPVPTSLLVPAVEVG